jgi:hypothetical protein
MNKLYDEERINRAKTQRIYLINRDINDDFAMFEVMGTTGNIYFVELDGNPTCTCPDFTQRSNRCKHILFMLVKLFNVPNPYQNKFTVKEIKKYIKKYKEILMQFTVDYDYDDISKLDPDIGPKCVDDNCVVCMDPLSNGEKYIYCKKFCGRCLHVDCYTHLIMKNPALKCPYCMQEFVFSKHMG